MGKKSKGKDKARKKERKRALLLAAPDAAEPSSSAAGLTPDRTAVPGSAAATAQAGPTPVASPEQAPQRLGSADPADPAELAARLASLSTVLQRHLARADAGTGLTRARLSALALLVLGGPRTLGELAAAEHVRPPTMTRLVQAMEADGLVVRRPNPDDGRSVLIEATAGGVAQLEAGRARQVTPLAGSIADLALAERVRLEDAADLLGRVLRQTAWEPAAEGE